MKKDILTKPILDIKSSIGYRMYSQSAGSKNKFKMQSHRTTAYDEKPTLHVNGSKEKKCCNPFAYLLSCLLCRKVS